MLVLQSVEGMRHVCSCPGKPVARWINFYANFRDWILLFMISYILLTYSWHRLILKRNNEYELVFNLREGKKKKRYLGFMF